MKTNIRTGYVQLRNGDWFATVDGIGEPAFVVARSLTSLAKKAQLLRDRDYEVGTVAWQQIGHWQDSYTKPHYNAI